MLTPPLRLALYAASMMAVANVGVLSGLAADAPAKGVAAPALPPGLELTTPSLPDSVRGTLRMINEKLMKGIDPADNAAVLLVPVYGEWAFEGPLADDSMTMMGIQRSPQDWPELVRMEDFLGERGIKNPRELEIAMAELDDRLAQATMRPWSAEEFPDLAEYYKQNDPALAIISLAAGKPRYFAPMLSVESPPRLLAASLTLERRLPFVARLLLGRSMLKLNDGDIPGCEADLLTCHKLASLVGQGSPFDVSLAKAHVIDAFAFQGERALIKSGQLTGPMAAAYLKQLDAVSEIPTADMAADVGERAILRQEIEFLESDPESVAGFLEGYEDEDGSQLKAPSLKGINWLAARVAADEVQNRYVAAIAERDRVQQAALFDELDKLYEAWSSTDDVALVKKLEERIRQEPDAISRWIGTNMAWSLKPLYRQRRATDDRYRCRRDLVRVALAVLAYHGDHQEYPRDLAVLVPMYLPSLPTDPHSDLPLAWRPDSPGGPVLISFGTNLTDDANQNYNDDQTIEFPAGG